jgi:hypothetical protein
VKIGCTTLRRGATVDVVRPGTRVSAPAVVTELVPLGSFATWHAERAGGDHLEDPVRKIAIERRGAVDWFGNLSKRRAIGMSKGVANSSCNGEAPCEARLLLLPATMWPRRGAMESAMIAQLQKRETDDLDIDIKLTALEH